MRKIGKSRREFLRVMGSAAVLVGGGPSRGMWKAGQRHGPLRAKLAADPLRPQFHLLPAKNWMNDPNGPIYWKGAYHMFFQYNPHAAVWGDMHWAHAVSSDMIHWQHLPVAMAPTPGGDDAQGCFTGSAVDDHHTATILYTGVRSVSADRATLRDGVNTFREVQCLATCEDLGEVERAGAAAAGRSYADRISRSVFVARRKCLVHGRWVRSAQGRRASAAVPVDEFA
jgi:beta-fructofuranosidase